MLKKISLCLALVAIIVTAISFRNNLSPNRANALRTIIIDPGHGGDDGGAQGSFSKEKDICLAVSLKLGDLLKKELPNTKILFTRTTDIYPDLHSRADFANESRGDLFVSIHVNSAPSKNGRELTGYKNTTQWKGKGKSRKKVTVKVPQYRYYTIPNPAKGTETYIWGAHKNDEKEVALRENAPMLMEENYQAKYGNIDPNSQDFIVMASLKTKQFFKRSATLALHVEEEFRKVGRASRDIKQRAVGIWVLQATAMPSILVETGYISNKEEEEYLNSDPGQQEIAQCIATAIKRYKVELESSQVGGVETGAPISNEPPSPYSPSVSKEGTLPKK